MYQKASVAFVIVASLLLLAVLYLSISRAVIHVTPVPQTIDQTVNVVIVPEAVNEGEVTGYVVKERVSGAETVELSGEGAEPVPALATGTVTLKNETNVPQPLVATTRLLSEGEVLFRLKNNVTVPANGEVMAEVVADQPGESGNIEATKFTIPGLNAVKQQSIYAVSNGAMKGGVQFVRAVTQEDLDGVRVALESKLQQEALETWRSELSNEAFDGSSVVIDSVSLEYSANKGDQVGVITLSATYDVTAVFYNQKLISDYVQNALLASLKDGIDIHTVDFSTLNASIESVNVEAERAELSVALTGTTILSSSNEIFNGERFVGKSEKEVIALLKADPLVEEVDVTFTPFWLERMPTLKDHIEVKIKSKNIDKNSQTE